MVDARRRLYALRLAYAQYIPTLRVLSRLLCSEQQWQSKRSRTRDAPAATAGSQVLVPESTDHQLCHHAVLCGSYVLHYSTTRSYSTVASGGNTDRPKLRLPLPVFAHCTHAPQTPAAVHGLSGFTLATNPFRGNCPTAVAGSHPVPGLGNPPADTTPVQTHWPVSDLLLWLLHFDPR